MSLDQLLRLCPVLRVTSKAWAQVNSPGERPLEARLWDSPGCEAKPVPILGLWFSESWAEDEDGGRKSLGKIDKSARTVNWEKVLSGKYPTEGLGISISVPVSGAEP